MFYIREKPTQLEQTKVIPSVSLQFKVRTILEVCLSTKYLKIYKAGLACLTTQPWTNLGSVTEALENKSCGVMIFKVLTLPILLSLLFLFVHKLGNHLKSS